MNRQPTELEVMLLDELRHVLLVHTERMITQKNYAQFIGEIKEAIAHAEFIMEGKENSYRREYKKIEGNYK